MRGQVWVESTVYTLIGLTLIAMVLSFALPKINAGQEKSSIEQTIQSFEALDGVISDVSATGAGNTRVYQIQFRKGEMEVDSINDRIMFYLSGMKSPYSQEGEKIGIGATNIVTSKLQGEYTTSIMLNYSGRFNITLNGIDVNKKFTSSQLPYKFTITNNGVIAGQSKLNIDISDI